MPYNILVVDDDNTQGAIVEQIIKDKTHYSTKLIENGQDAINALTSKDASNIDLVLLDLAMPGISGVDVLNAVKPIRPNLPIIVRTGYDDIDMAVEAMKAGATDFIKKFDSPDALKKAVDKALRENILKDEMSMMKMSSGGRTSFDSIVGESVAVKDMISLGKKVAKSDIPVLLEGESGCGKEFMARAIHADSNRTDKPFIAVNCGAIPENLVESILFGHEKGAFTGAVYKTFGKFREADGGTIFLDEVGELPQDIQVKLLRVLQDGEIDPVGSTKPVKVDVRIISATNRTLSDEVKEHKFREDLFYRLNVFPIYVPALRDRNGDISLLINHFIKSFDEAEGKNILGVSKEAENMLCKFEWPGNIRQLKNTIYRAVVLCESEMLECIDFPQVEEGIQSPEHAHGIFDEGHRGDNALMQKSDGGFKTISEIEKNVIQSALEYYNGHMSEISKVLGIGRSTLYRKLDEYNIPHHHYPHHHHQKENAEEDK